MIISLMMVSFSVLYVRLRNFFRKNTEEVYEFLIIKQNIKLETNLKYCYCY